MVDIDVNYLSEAINDKMDRDGHNVESPSAVMIESYVNGTSGYRIWSDGYCEQWGKSLLPPSGTQVNLLKTYKDTNYNAVGIFGGTTVRDSMGVVEINSASSFKLYHEAGLNAGFCLRWKTSGYLAEGQY